MTQQVLGVAVFAIPLLLLHISQLLHQTLLILCHDTAGALSCSVCHPSGAATHQSAPA